MLISLLVTGSEDVFLDLASRISYQLNNNVTHGEKFQLFSKCQNHLEETRPSVIVNWTDTVQLTIIMQEDF